MNHWNYRRAEEAERGEMLRTKAMRDRDAGIGMRIYHYTIIRIRFPDGLILQGTLISSDYHSCLFRSTTTSCDLQPRSTQICSPASMI